MKDSKKNKKKRKNYGKYIVTGIIFVLIDQISKQFFSNYERDFGFFAFTYVENSGITFGFLQGYNWLVIALSILSIGLLYYFKDEFKGKEWLLTLITAGIIGNFLDRVLRGYVIDFINFKFWPVFNFADIYLVIGIVTFIILALKEDFQNSSKS